MYSYPRPKGSYPLKMYYCPRRSGSYPLNMYFYPRRSGSFPRLSGNFLWRMGSYPESEYFTRSRSLVRPAMPFPTDGHRELAECRGLDGLRSDGVLDDLPGTEDVQG